MNVPSRKLSALAVVALGLLGCASDPLKATGLLGAAHGKDPLNFRQAAADPLAPVPSTVAGALRQAQNSRKAGDFEGAAKILSQLVLTSSDDPRIAGEYAKTLIELKRTDDAIAYLEHALQLAPGDWSLYSAQGVALDQKGDYIAAEKSYERALVVLDRPGSVVTVQRGSAQVTLNCSSERCMSAPTSGDDKAPFDTVAAQFERREEIASKAAGAGPGASGGQP